MANLSYPDDGVPPNPNTGKERGAKDDLMILNEFLERLYKNLEQEKTGNEAILNQRYFLNKLKDKWDISEDTVSAIMKSAREEMQNRQRLGKSPNIKSILRQELAKNLNIDAISNEIIDRMSKLFYYPSIDGVRAYEIDGVTENWAVSQKTWASKSQKYNKGTLPRSNNLEEMYKTVALAQVSFAHMMPSLSLLGQITYTRIMDGFLEHTVLSNRNVSIGRSEWVTIQGWGSIITEETNTTDTLEYLKSQINSKNAHISYESPQECSIVGSTKFDNIKNTNRQNLEAVGR